MPSWSICRLTSAGKLGAHPFCLDTLLRGADFIKKKHIFSVYLIIMPFLILSQLRIIHWIHSSLPITCLIHLFEQYLGFAVLPVCRICFSDWKRLLLSGLIISRFIIMSNIWKVISPRNHPNKTFLCWCFVIDKKKFNKQNICGQLLFVIITD